MLMSNALKQEVLDLVEAADNERLELVKEVLAPGRSRLSSMPPEEIAKLNAVIEQSEREFAAGKGISYEELMNNPDFI